MSASSNQKVRTIPKKVPLSVNKNNSTHGGDEKRFETIRLFKIVSSVSVKATIKTKLLHCMSSRSVSSH